MYLGWRMPRFSWELGLWCKRMQTQRRIAFGVQRMQVWSSGSTMKRPGPLGLAISYLAIIGQPTSKSTKSACASRFAIFRIGSSSVPDRFKTCHEWRCLRRV